MRKLTFHGSVLLISAQQMSRMLLSAVGSQRSARGKNSGLLADSRRPIADSRKPVRRQGSFGAQTSIGRRRPGVELLEPRRLLTTIQVTTTLDVVNSDDGLTSLREAVAEANATAEHDAIAFTGLTSGGPAAIVLSLGELWIREAVTIEGPGAHLLTIDASGNDPTPSTNDGDGSRVFEIFDGNGTPDKAVAINGVTLTGGDAVAGGGAIFSTELLTLNASTIHNNSALSVGGAVHALGPVTLAQSTLSGNSTPARGGGVYAAGDATLAHSTVSGNSGLYGGGIYSRGAVTITQSTISGNIATINGGGIYAVGGGAVTLTHSTVTGNNAAGLGGGIFNLDGPISISSSIVASNAAPAAPDVTLALSLSVNYSLIGDSSDSEITAGTGTGNLLDVDPRLGPLANNGGPTQTHALLSSSPAIDAGDPAATAGVGNVPLHDQRGAPFHRVIDGDGASGPRIDIGGIEYSAPVSVERPLFRPPVREPLPPESSVAWLAYRDVALEKFVGLPRRTSQRVTRQEPPATGSAIDVAHGDFWIEGWPLAQLARRIVALVGQCAGHCGPLSGNVLDTRALAAIAEGEVATSLPRR
jgi:predicted outer membrane repeat protein